MVKLHLKVSVVGFRREYTYDTDKLDDSYRKHLYDRSYRDNEAIENEDTALDGIRLGNSLRSTKPAMQRDPNYGTLNHYIS